MGIKRIFLQNVATVASFTVTYNGQSQFLAAKDNWCYFEITTPATIFISTTSFDNNTERTISGAQMMLSGDYGYHWLTSGVDDCNDGIVIDWLDEKETGVIGYHLFNISAALKPSPRVYRDLLFYLENLNEYVRHKELLALSDISYSGGYLEYESDYYFEFQQTAPYTGGTFHKPTLNIQNKNVYGISFANPEYEQSSNGYIYNIKLNGTFNNPEVIPVATLEDLQEVGNLAIRTWAAGTPHEVLAFGSKNAYYKQVAHIIGSPETPIWPPNSIYIPEVPFNPGGGGDV